jgi:hypothetical protein
MLRRVVWQKLTHVSQLLTASIISAITTVMIEAVSTSETSVNFYQTTRRNIPEDSHLHTRMHENVNNLLWFAPETKFGPELRFAKHSYSFHHASCVTSNNVCLGFEVKL